MTKPQDRPKIYHITRVDNLDAIVREGGLICDREMIIRGGPDQSIGMSGIKRRRVDEIEVDCRPGTKVGDYVPFYFCPRSIMLYVIHRGNHPDLTYRGGQAPIVHLEADLFETVRWAEAEGKPWAFSLSNAGARYCEFRSRLSELDQLNWLAIGSSDFRSTEVKEGKQAEFLLYERFPFDLIERIGVKSIEVRAKAVAAIARAVHKPAVEIRPEWYF